MLNDLRGRGESYEIKDTDCISSSYEQSDATAI